MDFGPQPFASINKVDAAFRRAALMAVGNMTIGNATSDATNNSVNCRKLVLAPATSGITDLVLGFAGFFVTNAAGVETNLPNAYTVTASIEYPIGTTPQQVFFSSGASSLTVNPGRSVYMSDPLPIWIPPGAQFAIKTFITWTGTMYFAALTAVAFGNEWAAKGTGLADHTLDLTAQTNSGGSGFCPYVFARLQNYIPSVLWLGDNAANGVGDAGNNVDQTYTFLARALRNQAGLVGCAANGGSLANYVGRTNGQNAMFRNAVTHAVMQLGGNDLNAGASSATLQANLQAAVEPYIMRGVRVHAMTHLPKTSSTDSYLTAANQTISSGAVETVRQTFNTWLRGNWQSIGLSGVIDAAHAVDPTDSGKWGFDAGVTVVGTAQALGQATLTNGVVTAMAFKGGAAGFAYGNVATVPVTIYPFPGETGSGATGTATSNSSGQLLTWTVTAGGSGYQSSLLIAPSGPWTADGYTPNTRGANEIIVRTGLGPALFTFS